MAHTPGPWELYKHMGEIRSVRLVVADSRGICHWAPDNEHYPTREGDFYLIHAAPDLLAACKAQERADELHYIYAESGTRADYDTWMKADARATAMRRAAIAKAQAPNTQ